MGRPKGSKNKAPSNAGKTFVDVYRNDEGQLVKTSKRFRQGDAPPQPLGEDSKGDVRALLKGISLGLTRTEEITAQKLLDYELAYLTYIYESDTYLVPDYLGFCAFLGVTKRQMDYVAETKMRKEECVDPTGNTVYASPSEVIAKIKNDFLSVKSQLGLAGKIPPVVFIATMNNEGDWTQRTELTIAPSNPIQTASNAELDQMLKDYQGGGNDNQDAVDAEFKEV